MSSDVIQQSTPPAISNPISLCDHWMSSINLESIICQTSTPVFVYSENRLVENVREAAEDVYEARNARLIHGNAHRGILEVEKERQQQTRIRAKRYFNDLGRTKTSAWPFFNRTKTELQIR